MTTRFHKGKDNRLTWSGASADEIKVDYAIAPFDEAVRQADLIWGVGRLPGLVSPDMAAKFGAALVHLNDRISACDAEGASGAAANAMRGIAAMDAAARASGAQPLPPDVWQIEVDGELYTVARDIDAWPAIQARLPGVRLWSLREVALALKSYGNTVFAVKDAFPAAMVSEVRPKPSALAQSLGDEIPFMPERR